MNVERSDDRSQNDDLCATEVHDGSIAMLAMGPSKLSNTIVSDPIYQGGVFRFSVKSARRCS
jgi:hypothetical protein